MSLYLNYSILDKASAITLSLPFMWVIVTLYSCKIRDHLVSLWFLLDIFDRNVRGLWSVKTEIGCRVHAYNWISIHNPLSLVSWGLKWGTYQQVILRLDIQRHLSLDLGSLHCNKGRLANSYLKEGKFTPWGLLWWDVATSRILTVIWGFCPY